MPDTESRPQSDGSPGATAAKPRAKPETVAGVAADAVQSEQRSFAEAGDAARRAADQAAGQAKDTAQTGLRAGQDIAAAGQDAMRKASGQAVDFWRSSLDPLANMQNELNRWFQQTWRQGLAGRMQFAPLFAESLFSSLSGAPVSDLYETPEGMELKVDLPGMSAEDVQLSLKGDMLVVEGERTDASTREEGAYRVRERRSGSFHRTFVLPAGADRNGIQARFDKGVLTVSIPRSGPPETESRHIPVRS